MTARPVTMRRGRRRSALASRRRGKGWLNGRVLGGLVVIGAGILIGLAFGTQLAAHKPVVPAAPVAADDPPAMDRAGSAAGGEESLRGSGSTEASMAVPLAPAAVASIPSPPPMPAPSPPKAQAAGHLLWQRNAVRFPLPASAPMIALVFDDLGMDRHRTERVIALAGPLTLSFLPYAGDLPRQTRAAHAAGHELLVHMPMEPLASGIDPGPGVLLTSLSAEENLRRLDHGLAAFDGYVGFNNHMGSRFTSDQVALAPILAEAKRRGLLFLDSVTAPSTVGSRLAAGLALAHTQRNVFLDDEVTSAAVQAGLRRLEQLARQSGTAVGIGHPHDVTLEAVAAWLPGLAARGFVLAPVSAVVRARGTTGDSFDPAASPAAGEPKKGHFHG